MRLLHNVGTGKYIAQASHAVLGSILRKFTGKKYEEGLKECKEDFKIEYEIKKETAMHAYLTGIFKKITLAVDSEEELLNIHKKIEDAGYESTLIIDSGLTEFGGKETPTCLAVEPLEEEKIDKITNYLKVF